MVESINKNNKNKMINKIRSKYIVIEIFKHLNLIKLLNVIRYSKKYQKLMNKNLKSYKNEFWKIEIEIIPKENAHGQFINIPSENIRKSIHIYFNDNEKEIMDDSFKKDDNVSKIKIIINSKTKYLSHLFSYCGCMKKINFIKFYRNDIKNMSCMFDFCSSLKELNLSNFNTKNVTNVSCMFRYCRSLKELNLSNFNSTNIIDTGWIFNGCNTELYSICTDELIRKANKSRM